MASDDVFIPAMIYSMFHFLGSIALITTIANIKYDYDVECSVSMYEFLIGYLIILLMMVFLELMALFISCRGSVRNHQPRKFLHHILYSRLCKFNLRKTN
jgi:hypothetical protein